MPNDIEKNRIDQLCSIRTVSENMPKSYQRIMEYLRAHISDLEALSITQLARKTNVDPANITRFCQSLGFSGYSDFKFSIKHNITTTTTKNPTAFLSDSSTASILMNMQNGYQQIIREVFDLLDPKLIDRAAQKIFEAKKVHIYSQDGNMMAAEFAQFLFWQTGIPSYLFSDANIAVTSATHLGRKDVAIGIAFSGDAKMTVDAILAAQKNHATIISVCGFSSSILAKTADISLCCNAKIPDDLMCIPIGLIGEIAIISAVQSTIVNKYHDQLEPYFKDAVANIQKNRYNF